MMLLAADKPATLLKLMHILCTVLVGRTDITYNPCYHRLKIVFYHSTVCIQGVEAQIYATNYLWSKREHKDGNCILDV